MQTEVPVLPVVCSDGHKRSNRKINGDIGGSAIERAPYKHSMRLHCASEPVKGSVKNPVGQRIISAKTLRVKELQNQLTDAHYHLNELANENRLLKALQKRQDAALKRYEGTNAELPRIINSHHEELKVLQIKYKRLKSQHKQACDSMKEKENEIHSLQTQNKHLLQLNRDKHLLEREKLQVQVSDLNHRIEQQQETIQTLNRKLTLESKSLKHQLHVEIAKHKETQRQLTEALEKLKSLEELLDNREKRLYHSGQLPAFNKRKALTSQSLTNLGLSHLVKSSSKIRDSQNDFKNKSLPKLPTTDSGDSKPSSSKTEVHEQPRTETMASLHQIRKFRLRKPHNRDKSSTRPLTDRIKIPTSPEVLKIRRSSILNSSLPTDMNKLSENSDPQDLADEEIKNIVEAFEKKINHENVNISKDLRGYYTSDSDSDNDHDNDHVLPTSKSRDLHSKLINGVIDDESLRVERNQENSIKTLNESSIEGKLAYKRLQMRDLESLTSSSDSEVIQEDDVCDEVEKSEDSLKLSKKSEAESSQERLMSITKSWTELQGKIIRERELSEAQLRALKGDDDGGEKNDDNLLNYFEKIEDEEREIIESQGKSRRGTFGLENSSFTSHNEVVDDNSMINQSDSLTNGESSSFECETPFINRRKSSDGVVEANIDNFRRKTARNGKIGKCDKPDDNGKINFSKDKLLAAMKAIDDNENIEDLPDKKLNRFNNPRSQVTENLYRGVPTQTKKRDDIIKDIFSDSKVDNKVRSRCSKLH